MTRFTRLLLPLALLAHPLAVSAAAEVEAKVKAAYVYHLIKFVDWPDLPQDSFRVCVQGDETVAGLLGELSNRKARDLPLRVEISADMARCQVLYLGRGEPASPDLLARARRQAVLTISDQPDFARRGGVVGFYSDAGKIRLEVNPEAARAANLRLSAKLLELARTVPAGKD